MENGPFTAKLLKRSTGYFWTGVGCMFLGALALVFLIVMLILDPTIATIAPAMVGIILGGTGLIGLGFVCMGKSKSVNLAELGGKVDFSKEELFGTVLVTELKEAGFDSSIVFRDLHFYSTGIWSPDPSEGLFFPAPGEQKFRLLKAGSYTVPYADILKIRVWKKLRCLSRITIYTDFGSKHTFNLAHRRGNLKATHQDFLKCCGIVNLACPDKLETKYKYLKDALSLRLD